MEYSIEFILWKYASSNMGSLTKFSIGITVRKAVNVIKIKQHINKATLNF